MFSRETVTLDFEGRSVRWLTVSQGKVRRWNRVDFTAPSNGRSRQDPAQMGAELAQLFEAEAISRRRVVVSVSAQRSIFRTISLPKLDETLLAAAVQRKIRQEIPLEPQETDISWEVVKRAPESLEIYVVAIPREEIDYQMAILQTADVRPVAMDVKPLALIRTANRQQAIIINLEEQALSIVVIVGGMPQIIRTVPLGTTAPSTEGRLDLVGQELLRTTKFYNESHKSQPLPADCPLFLSGSNFKTSAMAERMAARSPYPLAELAPPLAYPSGLSLPEFSINIGLALKDL